MSGDVKDMVALLQVISDKRVTDEKFAGIFEKLAELVNEASTALAEAAEAAAKPAAGQAIDHDALGKAIAAALVVGIKSLPQPTVKVDMPEIKFPEQASWKALRVTPIRSAGGSVESYDITRKN